MPRKEQAISACINIYTYLYSFFEGDKEDYQDIFPYTINIADQLGHFNCLSDILKWLESFCEKLCTLLDKLRLNGIELQHIDFGGGLGIQYSTEAVPSPTVLVAALRRVLVKRGYGDKEMIFEAGRSLVGNSGALLMTVQYMKQGELKNFLSLIHI